MNTSPERQPQAEAPSPQGGYELGQEQVHETPATPAEGSGNKQPKQSAPPAATPTQIPVQMPDPTAQSDDDQAQATKGTSKGSLPASDVDLIEKHWVEKAKAIVDKTHDDPFKQKSEMSKVKASYIKERFNKTIPTDDAVRT